MFQVGVVTGFFEDFIIIMHSVKYIIKKTEMYLLAVMGSNVRGELFYLISIHYKTLDFKGFSRFIGIYFLEKNPKLSAY